MRMFSEAPPAPPPTYDLLFEKSVAEIYFRLYILFEIPGNIPV